MIKPTPIRGADFTAETEHSSRLIEALLFASPKPLTDAELSRHLPENSPLEPLLAALEVTYRGRGINLVRVAGGWTFLTAPDLRHLMADPASPPRKLTRAQLETLAIIAYHQPVTRSEIEEVRGVTLSPTTLDILVQTGWVEPKGRRETVGRPVTWVTTAHFLIHFGLDSVKDLPDVAELKAAGLLDARPIETEGDWSAAEPARTDDQMEEL